MSDIKSYRDLQVWQRAVTFAVDLYRVTDDFPGKEAYGLTNHMPRAAVSIASNFAEGYARPGKEFGRFLGIAQGSLAELETQMEIAHRVGLFDKESFTSLTRDLTIIGKQLNVLRQRLT